jgi:hypothetical protein
LPGRALQTGQGTEDRRRVSDSAGFEERTVVVQALSIVRRGAPEAQALYAETDASIAKREAAAAMRKAGSLGVSTDGKPSKKQRRDLFKFRGSSNDE